MKKIVAMLMDYILFFVYIVLIAATFIVTIGIIIPLGIIKMLFPLIGYSLVGLHEWSHNTPITFSKRLKANSGYELLGDAWGVILQIVTLKVFKDLKKGV